MKSPLDTGNSQDYMEMRHCRTPGRRRTVFASLSALILARAISLNRFRQARKDNRARGRRLLGPPLQEGDWSAPGSVSGATGRVADRPGGKVDWPQAARVFWEAQLTGIVVQIYTDAETQIHTDAKNGNNLELKFRSIPLHQRRFPLIQELRFMLVQRIDF